MADSDADDEEDTTKSDISISLADPFLEDIDATWQDEGYSNRNEFIRDVVRDAVKHPDFSRET